MVTDREAGVIVVILCVLLTFFLRALVSKPRGPYPPGPKPKFLVGNLLDFPEANAAEKYLEWGRWYNSDIVHITLLGKHVVVINKRRIAEELLDKRARIYSGRMELPTLKAVDSLGWEYNFAFINYGQEWRKRRRMCQQHFNRQASTIFEPIETQRVRKMLSAFLHSPEKFDVYNKILSVSIPLDIMFGYDIASLEDPVVRASTQGLEIGGPLLLPFGSLINVFPFLRHIPPWFPGAVSQRNAAQTRQLAQEMKRIPFQDLKERMAKGQTSYSVIGNFLEKQSRVGSSQDDESLDILSDIAYTLYGGASDTTISATSSFLYLMATNPDVQKKAHAEIDALLGAQRLPEFYDRPSLPYIEAMYRELMRCTPPLRLGINHLLAEDDVYGNYFLPKGSIVFANIWAMTHDPEVYENPDRFMPERFFKENGELNDDDRVLAYGFGRRVCVGKYVASSTMWMVIVSILACFNIDKAKDEFGNDIEIDDQYLDVSPAWYDSCTPILHALAKDSLSFSHKMPFKCSIVPRSDVWRSLIKEATTET
ncbi:hypothetical protein NLJ89_g347 [Agrocybe chaxingu]|uniref:Cytochrome P450 n=1 Tax=Agrocybe chaxingu TaxID=84603 RepID=A0A9W8N248_9AGAR|nr:hypothetical protein NLJ89_g347 [Agrocybe chaxingu]